MFVFSYVVGSPKQTLFVKKMKKKSNGVKSYELSGEVKAPLPKIIWSGN